MTLFGQFFMWFVAALVAIYQIWETVMQTKIHGHPYSMAYKWFSALILSSVIGIANLQDAKMFPPMMPAELWIFQGNW